MQKFTRTGAALSRLLENNTIRPVLYEIRPFSTSHGAKGVFPSVMSNLTFFRRNLSSTESATSNISSADATATTSTYSESGLSLSETMRRVLSLENASQEEKNAFRLRQVMKEFQLHPTDTGPVQILYSNSSHISISISISLIGFIFRQKFEVQRIAN